MIRGPGIPSQHKGPVACAAEDCWTPLDVCFPKLRSEGLERSHPPPSAIRPSSPGLLYLSDPRRQTRHGDQIASVSSFNRRRHMPGKTGLSNTPQDFPFLDRLICQATAWAPPSSLHKLGTASTVGSTSGPARVPQCSSRSDRSCRESVGVGDTVGLTTNEELGCLPVLCC